MGRRIMNLKLEELSDSKLIDFYLEELRMIDFGQRAKVILPRSVRKKLVRGGFLKKIYNKEHGGIEIILSELTRKLIYNIDKIGRVSLVE